MTKTCEAIGRRSGTISWKFVLLAVFRKIYVFNQYWFLSEVSVVRVVKMRVSRHQEYLHPCE